MEFLALDTVEHRFILNVDRNCSRPLPVLTGSLANMADHTWGAKVYTYYGAKPYWN